MSDLIDIQVMPGIRLTNNKKQKSVADKTEPFFTLEIDKKNLFKEIVIGPTSLLDEKGISKTLKKYNIKLAPKSSAGRNVLVQSKNHN